jgi:translocation and assembly module TamB
LTVQASTSTGEFTAQTTFASSGGGKLRFGDLRASAPGLQVTGEVLADLDGGLLDGAMDGRFAAPSPGIVVGDQRVTGQAQIALRLVPVGGRQRAEVTLDGAPFAMAAGDGTVVSVTAVRASATVADAFGAMTGEADVTVQDLRTDGLGLAVARLNASGNRARGSGTFSLRTDQAEPSELAGSVTWQVGEGRMVLAVTDLTGNLAGEAVLLGRPMEVQRLGEAITVAPVDLAIGEGRLGGQLTRAAGGTSLRLQVDRLPLAATRAFLPDAALSGRVDGNLELRPEGRLLGGTLDLRIADLGSGSQEGAEGLSLNVGTTAQLAAGRLALSGEARGLPGEPLVFSAAVPLAVDARTLTPLGDGAKAIDGRLTWQGPVRPIWEKFGPDNHLLEGVGKVDIGVGGTWAQPLVSGSIGLEDGAYQQFDLGTLIEDLDIDVDLRDTLAMTVAVRGNDGRQGRISAIGRGERDAQGSLAAEVSVDLEGAQLVRRDDVTATTSGSVTLQMQATGSRLEGRLEPKDVQVRLIEALPPSVVQLEVIEIGEPPHGRRQAPAKAAPSFETALAVTVNAPRRIFVRGRGLESEWSADLAVVGTAAAPRVTGAVKLVRGQFSFGGKRFALTEGVISFTGGERIDPSLRIAAEYRATDLTALIRVTGEASKPEIEITSTPALPREEILARVLFGRSAANLGPVEAVQLAAAIDGLARGQTVTTTGLDTVREFLGLDVLTWEAGETEDDAGGVAVGRYIGDRVYVGGKQTTEGATAGTVAIEIIPNVTLESEVDQKENRSLGLRWRWDY